MAGVHHGIPGGFAKATIGGSQGDGHLKGHIVIASSWRRAAVSVFLTARARLAAALATVGGGYKAR